MNILVVGNGFDLAHGLPTKYTDFLKFVEVIRQIIRIDFNGNIDEIDWKNINADVKQIIENNMNNNRNNIFSQKNIWFDLLDENIWIDYFLQCNMYQKENWIDFENEISLVIQKIDNDMKKKRKIKEDIVSEIPIRYIYYRLINDTELLKKERNEEAEREIIELEKRQGRKLNISEHMDYLFNYDRNHPIENTKSDMTYKQLISRLEQDLNRLIRALEIYIVEYVEKINCGKLSPDIQSESFNAVLSFNYTDTYMRLYQKSDVMYDYIHGKAECNNNINNMVLGVEEYLPMEMRDKDIDFIMFKKYYQRIFKGTGCEYKFWVDKIKESGQTVNKKLKESYCLQIPISKYEIKHNLFIFGHSLDVTDRDILRELILNDNIYTIIYYHKDLDDDYGQKDLAEKITNLVKIIGQDELIRRTGGVTKTIEFRLQKDMS